MSNWKLATKEQTTWLKTKGAYTCYFARFWWGDKLHDPQAPGWSEFNGSKMEVEWLTEPNCDLHIIIHDPKLAKAEGFPMGEAVTESLAMRMARDGAEQAFEQSQALTEHIAKVHTEQAQAQADAEWQKERRAAWVAFCSLSLPASVDGRAEFADEMLAEFDKRFGEGK